MLDQATLEMMEKSFGAESKVSQRNIKKSGVDEKLRVQRKNNRKQAKNARRRNRRS